MINSDGSVALHPLFDTTVFAKGCDHRESYVTVLPPATVQEKLAALIYELAARQFASSPRFIFPLLRTEKIDPKPIQSEEHAYSLFFREGNEDLYLQTFMFTKKISSTTSSKTSSASLELSYRIDWTNHPDIIQRNQTNPHTFPHIHFIAEEKSRGKKEQGPVNEGRIQVIFNQMMRLSTDGMLAYQQEITIKQTFLSNEEQTIQSLIMTRIIPNISSEMLTPTLRPTGPVQQSFIPDPNSQNAHFITLFVQARRKEEMPYKRTYCFRTAQAPQEEKARRLTHSIEWTSHGRRDTYIPHVLDWDNGNAQSGGNGHGCGRAPTEADFAPREAVFPHREAELAPREAELAQKEADLAAREADPAYDQELIMSTTSNPGSSDV